MQLTDILSQVGGIQSMARELGISESQAASGTSALLPAILGGMKKQATQSSAGLGGLAGVLGSLGGGALLDNVLNAHPTDVSQGNQVLGQIFGSKDVSHAVADNAAGKTGLDPALLKKMLPIVAMLVAGYMAKQHGAGAASAAPGGGLGGLLGGLLGGGSSAGAGAATGGLGGLGGLASMLDMNKDGNALDDIIGMASKFGR